MPPQRNAQRTYNEGTLSLAIQATQAEVPDSTKHASRAFDVPRTTLRRRRDGTLSRRDTEPNSKKLDKLEEHAIVQRILKLDAQGVGATRTMVQEMANDLRAARGKGPVGKCWVDRFTKRTDNIKLRRSRPYDRQRALNEDARVIMPWFKLVEDTKAKYGILDEDTHNFDETGFMMGVITAQMVFTGTEKRSNPKKIQPGNRQWVTIIQGICAAGWAIPPFIIFSGKVLITSWYPGLPHDWIIETSPNGWTSNELALKWLKHFDAHTKERTVGAYRLLIVDSHESHNSYSFHKYCKEQKIIVLCMPSHSSHLLQPLDVGCFGPLKRAYYTEIDSQQTWWLERKRKLSKWYKSWKLDYTPRRSPDELDLPRATLARLLSIRSSHGDFAWYHRRFKHDNANLTCSCGREKTPEHLVLCRKTIGAFGRWPLRPPIPPSSRSEGLAYIAELIRNPEAFEAFLQITQYHTRICLW